MGNRLCKNKRVDAVDNTKGLGGDKDKTPSRFDRIINRLHLKPTTWKSEPHLNKKENNRSKSEEPKRGESIFYTKPLSKSSDWTEVDLEVPSKEDEHIHLRNPKLNLIFDNENGTPTPPPRKQQKGSNFREKIEKIASKGLQAFQSEKNKEVKQPKEVNQVPVEEPLIVKKKINYDCPVCDNDQKTHNRDHHHHQHGAPNQNNKNAKTKREKNLSVVSLPNYTDLKLTVAHPKGTNEKNTSSKPDLSSSRLSLQQPTSKKLTSSQSTGKLDSYISRCRSFGSIFPQQLKKLKVQKNKTEDITSDDSFGPLEDWDVGLIEHYNPKDASLPRPRKTQKEVLEGIEGLIVQNEDIEEKPQRPLRRSESLVKKINKEASKQLTPKSPEDICLTPPPSPVNDGVEKKVTASKRKTVSELARNFEDPVVKRDKEDVKPDLQKRESVCEHSSLMKILQEFSIKDTQEKNAVTSSGENESNLSSLTPSLVEFEKTLNNFVVEDFINAEKNHTKTVCS